jgi:hypothetical protein
LYSIGNLKKLAKLAQGKPPQATEAFRACDKSSGCRAGAIRSKLQGVDGPLQLRRPSKCVYCVEPHRKSALETGAAEAELTEFTSHFAPIR